MVIIEIVSVLKGSYNIASSFLLRPSDSSFRGGVTVLKAGNQRCSRREQQRDGERAAAA